MKTWTARAARILRAGADRTWTWPGLLLLTLLAIYLPGIGRGFIKDDFVWIAQNRMTRPADLLVPFTHAPDFYRPIVALSFAADWRLFGAEPLGYGLTNLALLLASAVALGRLAIAIGLPRSGAFAAAAVWSLNFHGINMALLWICGRTSLLATLFALLAAGAFVRRRPWAAGWALLAMLSKEEAALLPFVLLAWAALPAPDGAGPRPRRIDPRRAVRRTWPLLAVLAIYLAARTAAGGMTPWTAPVFYRFALEPASIGRNAIEYLDRAATLPAAAVLILALAAGAAPRPNAVQRRQVVMGILWMVGGYGLAVLLPGRSSLHAVGPAAGAAIACAALLTAVRDRAAPRAQVRMAAAAALAAAIAVPIHWSRNDRWVTWAELSTHVLDTIAPAVAALPPDGVIRLDDEREARANLDSAFGTLIETAVLVRTGLRRQVWVEPPAIDWRLAGLVPPDEADVAARFRLRDGVLTRVTGAGETLHEDRTPF